MKAPVLSIVLALMISLPLTAVAQDIEAETARTKAPEYEQYITLNFVLVDAIVTDRRGNYLHNLTKEDFRVFEEGREVEILSIDEYRLGNQQSADFTDMASGTIDEELRPRNIILFFDMFYTTPRGLQRGVRAAEDFITNTVQPGDNVMVAAFNGSLQIIQPFTSDKLEVSRALQRVGLTSGSLRFLVQAPEARSDIDTSEIVDQEITDTITIDALELMNTIEESERLYDQNQSRNFIRSVEAIAQWSKQYPGRKTMIMLSEGMSFNSIIPAISEDSDFASGSRIQTDANMSDVTSVMPSPMASLTQDYNDMLRDLNDAKTSIYSIDIGGLKGRVSTTHATLEDQRAFAIDRRSRQDFLTNIAGETGGKAYFNRNDIVSILDEVEEDISNYYVIGYRSNFDPDNAEYRNVDIRVNLDGASVKHRDGYFTPQPFTSLDAEERRVHLQQGFVTKRNLNQTGADLKFFALPHSPDEVSMVMSLEIPEEEIQSGTDKISYELWAYNMNDSGEVTSGVHRLYEVGRGDVGLAMNNGLRIVESLNLNNGSNAIGVGLRNNVTGERSYFFLNRQFKPAESQALLVSAPIIFDPEDVKRSADVVDLKVGNVGMEGDNLNSGADYMVHPIHGAVFPLLAPEISRSADNQKFMVIISNLDLERGESPNLEFNFLVSPIIDGQVSDEVYKLPTTKPVFMPYRGGQRFVLETSFDPENLEPGEYAMIVIAADNNTKRLARGSSRITITEQ